MQAFNFQGICIILNFSESVFTNYIFSHFFSFPRSSIDTNFFLCLPIFLKNWFQGQIIGNLQALPTLLPYTNPYRSTHPPRCQLTVVLIKKNAPFSHRGSKLFTWLSGERSHYHLFPTPPPSPTPPPRLVFYYLHINHLIDKGQYFQLEET